MAKMEIGARADAPGLARDPWGAQPASTVPEPARPFLVTLVKGVRVATGRGDVAVEDIVQDDAVLTQGTGVAPVVAVSVRHLTRQALIAAHRLTPVLLRAGALGAGRPDRDLCLHPGTLLCADAISGGTGTRRATDLIGAGQVMRIFPDGVTYVALALCAPAAVRVSGVWLAAARHEATAQGAAGRGWRRIGEVIPDWAAPGTTPPSA